MERKIGEVFELDGHKLQVKRTKYGSCNNCYFLERNCFDKREITGECVDDFRSDNNDVIFIDVTDEESK